MTIPTRATRRYADSPLVQADSQWYTWNRIYKLRRSPFYTFKMKKKY
jgi:hypothetical protein